MCVNEPIYFKTKRLTTMTSFSTSESSALERNVEVLETVSFRQDLVSAYELSKCVSWVQSHAYKRVCLQFPDEMLCDAALVASYLSQSTSANIFTLADTSYARLVRCLQ